MSESCKAAPTRKKARKERKRRKLGETNNTEEVMEHIWKDFPEELLEPVMARLPIATILRFRTVCRKWISMVDSASFSRHHAQVSRSSPWFYTVTHGDSSSGAIYDPSATKWCYPAICSRRLMKIAIPVASAGGLVCIFDGDHRKFHVCNPLTRSLKVLPVRLAEVWTRVAVGMTTYGDSGSGRYMILWVGCSGEYEVYDSMKKSWTRPGSFPSGIKLPLGLNFMSKSVSIDGTLHFMRSDPDGIVSYDMGSGIWMQFIIPSPLDMTNHYLAECEGRLMLVAQLTKNSATCVCIWELQKMTLLWKEVDRMPNIWCLEFYGKHVTMSCLGNKDMVMLSLRSGQMHRLVTYNLSSREWDEVPGSGRPPTRKLQWSYGTAFYPSLTAAT